MKKSKNFEAVTPAGRLEFNRNETELPDTQPATWLTDEFAVTNQTLNTIDEDRSNRKNDSRKERLEQLRKKKGNTTNPGKTDDTEDLDDSDHNDSEDSHSDDEEITSGEDNDSKCEDKRRDNHF